MKSITNKLQFLSKLSVPAKSDSIRPPFILVSSLASSGTSNLEIPTEGFEREAEEKSNISVYLLIVFKIFFFISS